MDDSSALLLLFVFHSYEDYEEILRDSGQVSYYSYQSSIASYYHVRSV